MEHNQKDLHALLDAIFGHKDSEKEDLVPLIDACSDTLIEQRTAVLKQVAELQAKCLEFEKVLRSRGIAPLDLIGIRTPLNRSQIEQGGWYMASASNEDAEAFHNMGISVYDLGSWSDPLWTHAYYVDGEVSQISKEGVAIEDLQVEIERIGSHFFRV